MGWEQKVAVLERTVGAEGKRFKAEGHEAERQKGRTTTRRKGS